MAKKRGAQNCNNKQQNSYSNTNDAQSCQNHTAQSAENCHRSKTSNKANTSDCR